MPRGIPKAKTEALKAAAAAQSQTSSVPTMDVETEQFNRQMKPSDLRNFDGQLYVRNNALSMLSFDDGKGNIFHLDHATGEEPVGALPKEVALNPGFQKVWRRGDVTVSTDPAMEDELYIMESTLLEAAKLKAADLAGKMDVNPASKDIVQDFCVQCKTTVFVPEVQKKRNEVPTLCQLHTELEPLFTLQTKWNPETKQADSAWVSSMTQAVPV